MYIAPCLKKINALWSMQTLSVAPFCCHLSHSSGSYRSGAQWSNQLATNGAALLTHKNVGADW